MTNIVEFPIRDKTKDAITDVRNIPTNKLIKLFWDWDGLECDSKGVDCCKGFSIRSIHEEVNRRGHGKKVAV